MASPNLARPLARQCWRLIWPRGALLFIVKMNATGGTYHTKKNFWTIFGGAPFSVSGGTLASYTLLEGFDGSVRASGLMPRATGFESVWRAIPRTRNISAHELHRD